MNKEETLQHWNNIIARAKGNELSFNYSEAISDEFEGDVATLEIRHGEKKFIIGQDMFNVTDNEGNNLLHLAVKNNNLTLAAYLISQGVDDQAQNNDRRTCFELDEMQQILTTERALSSFNKIIERARNSVPEISKISECSEDQFLNVCKASIRTLKRDIFTPLSSSSKIRDIDQEIGNTGETLLHGSILCGKESLTNEILLRGANCNAQTETGITPLMTASIVGDIATITKLYENGANAHLTDAQGNNALIAAVMANKTESVRFLLQNNMIDPEHRNNDGKAAIDYTDDSEDRHNLRAILQVCELKNDKKRSAEELSINIDDKSSTQTPDDDPHKDKPNHKFYKLIKKSRDNSSGTNLGRR